MMSGGCLCGLVRYEADEPAFHRTLCHCVTCRRAAGAPVVAWFSVPRAAFRIRTGEPTRYASSPHGTRGFCPRCGTQLTFEDANLPDEVDVTTCSLDDPGAAPPEDHVWVARRVSCVRLADGLPEYRERRTQE